MSNCFEPFYDAMQEVTKRREYISFPQLNRPPGPGSPRVEVFLITFRHITVDRTPLDEGSALRRDLYLTTRNTHKIQISMLPAGFKPNIPANDKPQSLVLDRSATGIGRGILIKF